MLHNLGDAAELALACAPQHLSGYRRQAPIIRIAQHL
jgi:hypothetical protein